MKFYDMLTEFIFVEHEPQKADYIFIPGSGYGEIAAHAAKLYREGYAPAIAVSGKHTILGDGFAGPQSPAKYVGRRYDTECDFLTEVLTDEGVPREAVLQEKEASYTYENAILIRRLLGEKEVRRAIISCQAYHARRSLLYFQLLFPETTFFVCPTPTRGITRENWFTDPEKIDMVLGEVERCGSQFHQIMREELAKSLAQREQPHL